MGADRKYLVAVALLAALAIAFGLVGTVIPVTEIGSPQESSSSDSFTRFASTEATYDSEWVDITNKCGQYFTLTHGLNTTEVIVDIAGKHSPEPEDGALDWCITYGGTSSDRANSLVQTVDGGYALAGYTYSYGVYDWNFYLVKTDSDGIVQWDQVYGEPSGEIRREEYAYSLVQTVDGGYALAGYTNSSGAGLWDFWLVKTDSAGIMQWNRTYGGASADYAYSLVQTVDGGYALAGCTYSYGVYDWNFYLVKTDVESGLAWTGLTPDKIVLYRGKTDLDWNYVRVRLWLIKEPTWQFGDINMDGVVDAKDLYILSRNYGKTFSLLSLTGIIAVTGIHAYKKRKKQPE